MHPRRSGHGPSISTGVKHSTTSSTPKIKVQPRHSVARLRLKCYTAESPTLSILDHLDALPWRSSITPSVSPSGSHLVEDFDASPNKHKWHDATQEEYDALLNNGTWILSDLLYLDLKTRCANCSRSSTDSSKPQLLVSDPAQFPDRDQC
jgi:hypothetical protein